ncbi:hypothetical protein DI487_01185 [Flavobacterium sediminis]|uniref:Gliding motility lipoprotein GldH n=1 Tax=Flavobacterium sediminis TaxID=2201181 RepID=A0A2U8QR66_9FLAO|nr:hypothetical protein [Flavobacterium sediminis]AWM12617.1 hypothetical protein DI487_01185 [Flavobacterium sediminis]
MRKISVLVLLLLIACNQNIVVDELDKSLTNNRWQQADDKVFEFAIEQEGEYQLELHLAHIYDFQFEQVPVEVYLLKEEQILLGEELVVSFKDDDGKELGECVGDICDLYIPVSSKIKLSEGEYRVVVQNGFKGTYLPNMLGVGIRLKKTP